MVIPKVTSVETLRPYQALSNVIHTAGIANGSNDPPLAIMQLNHAGRQSTNFVGGRRPFVPPLAPSAIKVGSSIRGSVLSDIAHSILFQTPKAMEREDIEHVVDLFINGARFAHQAGFDGVQLHVAHGCMLSFPNACFNGSLTLNGNYFRPAGSISVSQGTRLRFVIFIYRGLTTMAQCNKRTDEYGADNALTLLHHIISSIRKVVPKEFVLGVKLNAGDYASSSTGDTMSSLEKRAIGHILSIAEWGSVDFIEISGGDYEQSDFVTDTGSTRQAIFARASHQALQALLERSQSAGSSSRPLIMLTGGLRTPGLLRSVLANGHADLLGIGRSAILCPHLPTLLKEREKDPQRWDDVMFHAEPDLRSPKWLSVWPFRLIPKVQVVGAGAIMAWYTHVMRQLAEERTRSITSPFVPDLRLSLPRAVVDIWFFTPSRLNRILCRWIFLRLIPLASLAFILSVFGLIYIP